MIIAFISLMNFSHVRHTLISYSYIIHKIGFGNPYFAVLFLLPASKLTQLVMYQSRLFWKDSRYQGATTGRENRCIELLQSRVYSGTLYQPISLQRLRHSLSSYSLASHCWGPIKWDLWLTKWRWGGLFPSTSVSLPILNPHSIKFPRSILLDSIITNCQYCNITLICNLLDSIENSCIYFNFAFIWIATDLSYIIW
jgi:hypothetical protein